MSLSVEIYGFQHVRECGGGLKIIEIELYWSNITHNLSDMAREAGIYEALWRPHEIGVKKPKDIIKVLTRGLKELKSDPEYYKKYESLNGWGLYNEFIPFIEDYLNACHLYHDQKIRVYT